ncbi:hypothetical protein [Streptomyces sp. NPDC051162]|uniref:hypothetical protein n=1 Tax=Streptomyces sp. NPDC051162 TaxID=3154747 RepID=UPI00341FBCEC
MADFSAASALSAAFWANWAACPADLDINKNTWTPVGESADPQGRDHTLVEIRASK